MPDHPRVAVVGAGAFGVWTAFELVRRGAHVTLLDAWGAGNARSSSGGETRVIRGVYGPDRVYTEWVKRSFALWREMEKSSQTRLYHRMGLLWMFSVEDSYARKALPIMRELGFPIDQLTTAEAAKLYTQIDFTGVTSCYFEHEAGYLSARLACQTVCEAFQKKAGIFRQAAVKPGNIRGELLQGLALGDGTQLNADFYVFACGPWLGKLFPQVIGDKVEPSRQEVHFFGVPAGDDAFQDPKLPIWVDFGERLIYGIPGGDGRGFKVADDTRGPLFDPTNGDRTPSAEGIARSRALLARRFPRLRSAPLLEARVCQYENSPDGHFIIARHPEAKNVWLVGGGSGHGFKLSPALGECVAIHLLEGSDPKPFFGLKRLTERREKSTQFDSKK
jgi:glycine/D-amino acid oxidase-like deaminating enzyme